MNRRVRLIARLGTESLSKKTREAISFSLGKAYGSRRIELVSRIDGNQMNMDMWHRKAFNGNANAQCRCHGPENARHPGRCGPQGVVRGHRHVENIVDVVLGDEKQVARIDVFQREEHEVIGILKHDRRGHATRNDLAEDAVRALEHDA